MYKILAIILIGDGKYLEFKDKRGYSTLLRQHVTATNHVP